MYFKVSKHDLENVLWVNYDKTNNTRKPLLSLNIVNTYVESCFNHMVFLVWTSRTTGDSSIVPPDVGQQNNSQSFFNTTKEYVNIFLDTTRGIWYIQYDIFWTYNKLKKVYIGKYYHMKHMMAVGVWINGYGHYVLLLLNWFPFFLIFLGITSINCF